MSGSNIGFHAAPFLLAGMYQSESVRIAGYSCRTLFRIGVRLLEKRIVVIVNCEKK